MSVKKKNPPHPAKIASGNFVCQGVKLFARLWLSLIFILALGAVGFAVAENRTLTDLPPGLVDGRVGDLDVVSDAAPVGDVILRLCRGYYASCSVVIAGGPVLGWTCSGDPADCWRTFLAALNQLGIYVRTSPAVGGASYSFSFGGGLSAPAASSVDPADAPPAR